MVLALTTTDCGMLLITRFLSHQTPKDNMRGAASAGAYKRQRARPSAAPPSTGGRPAVITLPQWMERRMRILRHRVEREAEERRKRLSKQGNRRDVPLVVCKRPQFNQYKGQSYSRFEAIPLASQAWANRKSAGDFFVVTSHKDSNPSTTTEGVESFHKFGLRKEIIEKLDQMHVTVPTSIQALAIPHLLTATNAILAAETGSGKTLTYLLPLVEHVLHRKENSDRHGIFCAPLALVLVPGRELATQTHNTLKRLTESLNINTTLFLGGLGTKSLLMHPLVEEVDIVVSSFGVFSKLVSSGIYEISDVKHVVIDEADTMLDDSFNEKVVHFLKKFQFRDAVPTENNLNAGVQLCLAGATFPRSLDTILNDVLPVQSLVKIKTSHLHRLMSHVSQKFIRLRKMDKPGKLLELVRGDVKNNRQTIVFSKDAATCLFVSKYLEENGIKVTYFHGGMNAKLRNGKYELFLRGEVDVLSCTDLASRGLDTGKVHHIINFDFPNFVSDYIHRSGRTGRVGSVASGHVTSLISSGTEVALVNKIEIAARRYEELPNVNANILRQLMKSQLGPSHGESSSVLS